MQNAFAYGSLMFDEVWNKIVEGTYRRIRGSVEGYERRRLREVAYPGMIEGTGLVPGILWLYISKEDIDRLDAFEGEVYLRRAEKILTARGEIVAQVFLVRPKFYHLVCDDLWVPEYFAQEGLDVFMTRYGGFNRISQ